MRTLAPSVFAELAAVAERYGAVDLGQGYSDETPMAGVLDAVEQSVAAGLNQYSLLEGIPALREAIADHQADRYGLDWNPATDVTVTCGATEGIFAAINALCEQGDEVVLFEPAYPLYLAAIAMAGGDARLVRMSPPTSPGGAWTYDVDQVRAAITPRTRMVLVNTPHNPTGKVFTHEELEGVAELCVEHDLIAITDEVYERLVFSGAHHALASFPGMADRTVTISSASKTFRVTGWRIGWVGAPAKLTAPIRTLKTFLTICPPTPLQLAVAHALQQDGRNQRRALDDYSDRRDMLCATLAECGFDVHNPEAGYFAIADLRPVVGRLAAAGVEVPTGDVAFCRWMTELIGVAALPLSGFFRDRTGASAPAHLVRFSFCMSVAALERGCTRLLSLRELTPAEPPSSPAATSTRPG